MIYTLLHPKSLFSKNYYGYFNDSKFSEVNRYFSIKHAISDRDRTVKRISRKINSETELKAKYNIFHTTENFICFVNDEIENEMRIETFDEYLIRRTKDFNKFNRENPHDINS